MPQEAPCITIRAMEHIISSPRENERHVPFLETHEMRLYQLSACICSAVRTLKNCNGLRECENPLPNGRPIPPFQHAELRHMLKTDATFIKPFRKLIANTEVLQKVVTIFDGNEAATVKQRPKELRERLQEVAPADSRPMVCGRRATDACGGLLYLIANKMIHESPLAAEVEELLYVPETEEQIDCIEQEQQDEKQAKKEWRAEKAKRKEREALAHETKRKKRTVQ